MAFRSKYKLLSHHDIVLSQALTSDPIHAQLLEKISAHASLKDKIIQRSTALQVLLSPHYGQYVVPYLSRYFDVVTAVQRMAQVHLKME